MLCAGIVALWPVGLIEAKPVQLWDETLQAESGFAIQPQPAGTAPVSGLFLVQFPGPVNPVWRRQLSATGVELIAYVPEDVYLARLGNVSLESVRQLGFVNWIQAFQPRHKMHPAIRLTAEASAQANKAVIRVAPIEISLLLAPNADLRKKNDIRGRFLGVPRESNRRFGGIIRGQIYPSHLNALAESDVVLWMEPAAIMKLCDEVAARIVAGDGGLQQTLAQSLGYDGSGVAVAVADTGLHNGDAATMHPDLFGRATNFFFYGALTNAADENGHGTHVAGIIAGNGATGEVDEDGFLHGLGVAPGARIITQRIFDDAGNLQFSSWDVLAQDAINVGAVIGANSWGDDTQGRYDLSAMEFDELVRDADTNTPGDQPYILEFAAGNGGPGPQTIRTPAVGKNVIATGASQNGRTNLLSYADGPEVMWELSSRGPCQDGRIKPDLIAPGTWIASLKSASATGSNASMPISSNYQYYTGTSQAGPQVAAAAAVFVQYYRLTHSNASPSPALVKAALINAAHDLDNAIDTGPVPNMDEGWGRVNVAALVQPDRQIDFLDQTILLTNSQIYDRRLVVNSSAQPLKITLAYTDEPGSPLASTALVNDLDLVLMAPGGTLYRGNQFDENGKSAPNASQADHINNVEGIFLPTPMPGEYTLRVIAYHVPLDARRDTPEALDQDFALVVSGLVSPSGASVVLLDRQSYTAPGRIEIKVIDPDITNGFPAVVLIKSSTEPDGEVKVLQPSDVGGVYTGAVATATGKASPDQVLQIANGDSIQVRYADLSAGTNRVALADADFIAPGLHNVGVSYSYGRMMVSWSSDEPASSMILLGANPGNLALTVTSADLTQNHLLALDGLAPGQTYCFSVVSADEAGNLTTNSNGGYMYSFVAMPAPPVLLVDAYIPNAQSTNIPLTAYTDALDAAGYGHDIWSVLQNNAVPAPSVLGHYRSVIWRVNDSYHSSSPYSSLRAADQTLIQDYLDGGGGFFLGSMQILRRLGDVPFRHDILGVESYITNSSPYFYCPDCDEDGGVAATEGESGDIIGDGLSLTLDYANYPAGRYMPPDDQRRDLGDTFSLEDDVFSEVFTEATSGRVVGMRCTQNNLTSTGRVVFFSFPLDALPEASRAQIFQRSLSFLAPGSSNQPGTIRISNNLWQASFALTGPASHSGMGANALLTGVPSGQYTVSYGNVPYFQPPAPQTNMLPAGGNLVFTGSYTFPDENTNGISDAWELSFLGSVQSNRSGLIDADGDGANDYCEFISGTNPTNAASKLALSATIMAGNDSIRLAWSAVPGRAYCLETAGNVTGSWSTLAPWTQAVSPNRAYIIPIVNPASLFRVCVQP